MRWGSVQLTEPCMLSARLIKVEKPLYGVEVFVGETARFEIELSEPDVHGQWKLKGEPLTASPVSDPSRVAQIAVGRLFGYFFLGPPCPQSTIPW